MLLGRAVSRLPGGLALLLIGLAAAAPASAQQRGSASGLPVPRYVSLKSDRVNLREGPSKDHRTTWIFKRAGLPVEITAEFETWRKVRDSEGSEGWVLHSLLSGRRTGLVTPWKKDAAVVTVFAQPGDTAAPVAKPVLGVGCGSLDGYDGFIRQNELWGVYPDEVVE